MRSLFQHLMMLRSPLTFLLLNLFIHAKAQHDCLATRRHHHLIGAKGGSEIELWPIDILHQRIELDLTQGNVIQAACEVIAVPRVDDQGQLQLELLGLAVDSITSPAGALAFAHVGELLTIDLGQNFTIQDTIELSIHYHGDPVTDASGFGGFYTTASYIYNLGVAFESVPHSFGRAWFPCVDNFTERNTYEFIVKTHAGRNGWCNGELISETQLGGDTLVRHWQKDLPIPAYLASVAAANYVAARDTFPSISGEAVPVALIAKPQDTTAMKNSFLNLPNAFDLFEEWFGYYRWQKVGYVVTPVGAMEHSTSIHYPASIVDGTLDNEDVMAHEVAHEWFGNLVTCARAEEMYINEGFAEFLSFLFLEEVYGRDHYLGVVRANHRKMVHQAHLLDEGWWPLADVPQQWTYGEHSYNKGADVLHSLRGYLGDDLFRQGLTSFLNEYEFQPVTSGMLRDHLSVATGMNMNDFFADWIFQPGWAAFEIDSFSVSASDQQTTLYIQQKLRGASDLYNNVPLTVTCISAEGERWQSPDRIIVGGALSIATVSPPFAPTNVILNADELIGLAITADEDTLVQTGTRTYTNSNIRITTTAIGDPIPIRIEQYWVSADQEAEENFAYRISPDRWWCVIGPIPADATLNARIEYDGRPTTSGSLDTELMQDFGAVPFHEDSLVLLYRTDQHSPWIMHPSFTVQPLNNPTDKWGRIEFNGLQPGEYTLAWRKSPVGTDEITTEMRWSIFPNPANEQITISCDGNVDAGILELLDRRGRMVRWVPINSPTVQFPLNGIAAGKYQIRFIDQRGRMVNAGPVIVTK